MGKRSKNKKKGNYSRTQFIDIICSQCGICEFPDPKFCYNDMYKEKQDTFLHNVYPNLTSHHKENMTKYAYESLVDYSDDKLTELFVACICNSSECPAKSGEECDYIAGCIMVFKKQSIYFRSGSTESKGCKAKKFILEAYPTFFCSNGIRNEAQITVGNSETHEEKDRHKVG